LAVGCGDSSSGAGGSGGGSGSGGSGGGAEPWVLSAPIDEARMIDERQYLVYVPSGVDLNQPTSLVLSFHGSTPGEMPAAVLQRSLTAGNPHAQENGYIIVYPQGLTRNERQGWDTTPDSPDILFVDDIVEELDQEFGLDEDRIFSGGISNGAAFSYTLACSRGDVFAAIGAVAGALPMDCPLTRRVPAIVFHGTEDARVSYAAGSASAEAWSQRNGCADDIEEVFQNGDTTCEAWAECQEGADVELCTVDGGGHTWPNSPFADIFEMFGEGKTTMDVDATDRMWRFFEAHPMP
jgi:polyhydroxybutyrate depolymerase